MPLCVCVSVCAHSVRTLSHDASSRRMTQTLEQLLKMLSSPLSPPPIHIKMKKPAPQLHLIYLDPPKKTWAALLTLEYLHMDGTQM